ncbi:hydrogenase maturation protease [Desulfonispora thiosulfatigenes DSM 11270]|uniref:Hydrogenase maturation protease n=1 Tax=Desulfonispora thiosulfatigenes DSM 11270 TaxID=656914 RepID=A0A1W1VH59_DESTI|nr:hydrogenase maturation protease [Desulfonispora thiosulfatigenes]SMB92682.1 hydrogenase maturation protease [Desulfonispora thiosulfatigenes DSM 11270]
MEKTIVVGLGNPIVSDDGVGNKIAMILKDKVSPDIDVVEASLGGFNLMDIMTGYDNAILIDAVQTKNGKVGDVYRLDKDSLEFSYRLASVHDINLYTALEFGKQTGIKLPEKISIFAIEVQDVLTFGESLTPEVEKIVPEVVEMVIKELDLLKN